MDHGDIRAHARHCGKHLAGERTADRLDQRVDLGQVGAGVSTQHGERQAGRTGHVGVGEIGVAVFLDFQRLRPVLLHRITQAVQRADAGVATPGKDQLLRAAGADQQVVDQVRGHPHQGQILAPLTHDFVSRGGRNEVGKAFQGDRVAVVNEALDGFAKCEKFSHESVSSLRCANVRVDENINDHGKASQSDNRHNVRLPNNLRSAVCTQCACMAGTEACHNQLSGIGGY